MKATMTSRDHRDVHTSSSLLACETFVGPNHHAWENGLDDSYIAIYVSEDVTQEVSDWIDRNLQASYHIQDLTFIDLDDLIDQINKAGMENDPDGFEGYTHDSSDEDQDE